MADVPCNGCTACCKGQRIILDMEKDCWRAYRTEPTRKGNDGPVELMLAHKPNGDCIYLAADGCSIHGSAPIACQQFDCRLWVIGFKSALAISPLDRDCANAAMERLTLKHIEQWDRVTTS